VGGDWGKGGIAVSSAGFMLGDGTRCLWAIRPPLPQQRISRGRAGLFQIQSVPKKDRKGAVSVACLAHERWRIELWQWGLPLQQPSWLCCAQIRRGHRRWLGDAVFDAAPSVVRWPAAYVALGAEGGRARMLLRGQAAGPEASASRFVVVTHHAGGLPQAKQVATAGGPEFDCAWSAGGLP